MRNHERHLCQSCRQHRALSSRRGSWRVRAFHDLCPRCWRSAMDRLSAELFSGPEATFVRLAS